MAAVRPTPILPASPPPGFVHVDLDGLWTLAGCYGYPEGESYARDRVFERGLPRLLELFDQLDVRATFFIVGRDLEQPAKRAAIAALAAAGHELANHSWSHHFGLESLAEEALLAELERTNAALFELTGRRPLGFRAPGYAVGPRLLSALSRTGLRYDGSRLPTRIAPALRWMAGRLRAQVRRQLNTSAAPTADLAGQYDGGGPLTPEWVAPGPGLAPILRLPLAVSPRLRLPLHASLGQTLGARYVGQALASLARQGQPLSYLLHGMDALGAEDLADQLPAPLLRTRPFQVPLQTKLDFLRQVLTGLKRVTQVQRTQDWFGRLESGPSPTGEPKHGQAN